VWASALARPYGQAVISQSHSLVLLAIPKVTAGTDQHRQPSLNIPLQQQPIGFAKLACAININKPLHHLRKPQCASCGLPTTAHTCWLCSLRLVVTCTLQ
jgi:hypothetical protein